MFWMSHNPLTLSHFLFLLQANEIELMRAGHTAFLATGDCYRRDEIDATHYPVRALYDEILLLYIVWLYLCCYFFTPQFSKTFA